MNTLEFKHGVCYRRTNNKTPLKFRTSRSFFPIVPDRGDIVVALGRIKVELLDVSWGEVLLCAQSRKQLLSMKEPLNIQVPNSSSRS